MVKLKGPGMAAEASGSLGGVLVFSNSRGRSYAKKLTKPRQPRPLKQISSRAFLRFLTQQWSKIDGSEIVSWDNYPQLPQLDRYHRYCQSNMSDWGLAQAPSARWPITRTGTATTISTWTAVAQGRMIHHTMVPNQINHGWGFIFLRDTAPITSMNFDLCVQVIEMPTPGTYTIWDGPLEPGTYYTRLRRFTHDGNMPGLSSTRTVTIA